MFRSFLYSSFHFPLPFVPSIRVASISPLVIEKLGLSQRSYIFLSKSGQYHYKTKDEESPRFDVNKFRMLLEDHPISVFAEADKASTSPADGTYLPQFDACAVALLSDSKNVSEKWTQIRNLLTAYDAMRCSLNVSSAKCFKTTSEFIARCKGACDALAPTMAEIEGRNPVSHSLCFLHLGPILTSSRITSNSNIISVFHWVESKQSNS